jgi:hypothetical protein
MPDNTVRIEVNNGITTVTQKPEGIRAVIIDKDEPDGSTRIEIHEGWEVIPHRKQ